MNTAELFAGLEGRYKLPSGYLNRVYQIESSGGKNVYNEASKAAGPFQFIPSTARAMGLEDPYSLEQSADAAARLAVQNRAELQRRGVENVDGRLLYLAHNQGAAGAYSLLSNADKPADAVVGEGAVTLNSGKKGQPAAEFANTVMSKYGASEGGASNAPYSALGESAPDVPEEDRGSSRRQAYALNTLMNATKDLEQKPAPMLAIPRLSYADGGIVSLVKETKKPRDKINVPDTTAAVVEEIQGIAKEGNLDEYKIAFLLRMAATNTIPPDRAFAFSNEILSGDVSALLLRFRRYPRSLRMLARLNLALGGLAGQGFGIVANQHGRSKPQPTKRMGHDTKTSQAFAKGGEVGGHNEKAQFELSQFAVGTYGPEIGNNMIRRSEGDPNKLFFALNQYAKNMAGPRSKYYARDLKTLQKVASKHRLRPVQAFNRTEDALETEQELDRIIRDVPKKDRVFRDALLRMKAMIGWKPKPVRS